MRLDDGLVWMGAVGKRGRSSGSEHLSVCEEEFCCLHLSLVAWAGQNCISKSSSPAPSLLEQAA